MKVIWITLAATLASGTVALAQSDDGDGNWTGPNLEVRRAQWARNPNGSLIYGKVKLDCGVDAKGYAGDCKVVSAEPADPKLEQAAITLSHLYKAGEPAPTRAPLTISVLFDTPPDWLKKPSFDNLMAVYPTEALKRGIGGLATIKCTVQVNGLSRACSIVKEDRPELGFGPAAAVLSRTFLFKPAIRNGQAVEAEVIIPINFKWDHFASDWLSSEPDGHTGSRIQQKKSEPSMALSVKVMNGAVWSKTPTVDEILVEIGKKVGDKFADGQVVLQCRLDKTSGKLSGCVIANASPGMKQFSDVAQSLTPKFQADPTALSAIKENVIVNLAFAFPDMSSPEWSKRYLTHPDWTRTISPDTDKATFPEAAAKAGLKTGSATVDCVLGADGSLTQCAVIRESTPDVGFGEMAKQIAQTFAANPWDDDGLPVGGAHVRMPIRMDYAPPVAPPTPATKP